MLRKISIITWLFSILTIAITCFIFLLLYFSISLVTYYGIPISVDVPILCFLAIFIILLATLLWLYPQYKKICLSHRAYIETNSFESLTEPKLYKLTPEYSELIEKLIHSIKQNEALPFAQKQAEYNALQNQINPHFLYNTLDAIRGDVLHEGMTNIANTIEALSAFFRYTITDSGKLTTIERELINVENYFTIQQYRFGDKLKLDINYSEDWDTIHQLAIPKLTIQPIIENSIYHGIEKKLSSGSISLSITTTETCLFINITDTGIGIAPEKVDLINTNLSTNTVVSDLQSKQHSGIALMNVSKRIKLLFGDEYGLHVFSILGYGTTVNITLPKKVNINGN